MPMHPQGPAASTGSAAQASRPRQQYLAELLTHLLRSSQDSHCLEGTRPPATCVLVCKGRPLTIPHKGLSVVINVCKVLFCLLGVRCAQTLVILDGPPLRVGALAPRLVLWHRVKSQHLAPFLGLQPALLELSKKHRQKALQGSSKGAYKQACKERPQSHVAIPQQAGGQVMY